MKKEIKQLDLSPEELRQMQLVQLEMLIEIERICNLHQIKYCLGYGTLLGAIRHKGFIPWDDDLDILILRSEYEKLYKVCETELGENFFLQDRNTDKYYRWGYSKLRRNGTEYIRAGQEHMHYKTGVFIDIFVMDNVSDNPFLKRFQNMICFALRKTLWSEAGKVSEKKTLLRIWYSLLSFVPVNFVFAIFNSIINFNNKKETKLLRSMLFQMFHKKEYGFKREWLTDITKMEFEGHQFPVPIDYHGYLTFTYHNYMQEPALDKRAGHAPFSTIQLPGCKLRKI